MTPAGMTSGDLYRNRERAELFGSIALDYDAHRPSYPPVLLDDLVARGPRDALDIGCGTGKAAVGLADRGVPVLGVEIDARMAAVARDRGVAVEVASFETWDDAGRRYDLITCAQAWHWIDPAVGVAKAARLLRPGGTLARFWNFHVLDGEVVAAIDALYADLAPEIESIGHDPSKRDAADDLAGSADFTELVTRVYPLRRTYSAGEWVDLVATFSEHQRLGSARLAVLQDRLRQVIDDHGGTVVCNGGAYARLARRAG